MDSGIDHVSDEVELRAVCAAGDREVVLDGKVRLSGDWWTDYHQNGYTWAPGTGPLQLADGTTLRGGTLRGGRGPLVRGRGRFVRGATVRIEGVAILDSQGHGILVAEGGVVAMQGGRIAAAWATASTCAARARAPA